MPLSLRRRLGHGSAQASLRSDGIARRLRLSGRPDERLHPIKLRAIDAAFQRQRINSFADLGGVWAVDGGYTFYALEAYDCSRAVLVDEEPTAEVIDRARRLPALRLLTENFGTSHAVSAVSAVGPLDAILLFDVLLHQVRPNWDDILRMYAPVTNCFVIVNPQYAEADRTTRLLDLGHERYRAIVPPQPGYEDLFERSEEFLPERGRRYGDIHNVWQWGIVDADLHMEMERLGFELVYFENAGRWGQQTAFENHAFVFAKSDARSTVERVP